MKQLSLLNKGRLFVFEGPDGVGKTTLCKEFSDHLKSKGVTNQVLSFPGQKNGSLGKIIYDIHHLRMDVLTDDIHPASLQILHLAAHIDQIEQQIKPLLNKGISVILDRYWWSLYVYSQISDIPDDIINSIIEIEKRFWGELEPETIFYIRRKEAFKQSKISQQLNTRYERLMLHYADNNIHIINNDSSLAAAVKALTHTYSKQNMTKSSNKVNFVTNKQANPPSKLTRRLRPTIVYDTYWKFAVERQNIFFLRQKQSRPPWTSDPILETYKFTNAYRASDRVSQYLIKEVIYKGSQKPSELLFRILLFKIFNKIETWELLKSKLTDIVYTDYSFKRYDKILTDAISSNTRIYSAAYIMPSGGKNSPHNKKHRMHLELIDQMIKEDLPTKIADSSTMQDAFELIKGYPTIGDFLAYQYVTDINYSTLTDFSEMDFVIPGPGAKSGINKCFQATDGMTETEIIKLVTEGQDSEFERLGLDFKDLWGRPLQYIDCQNLFCETDKYARVAHPEIQGQANRTRIKQKFTSSPKKIEYWYPPKWGINERIKHD